MTNDWLAPGAIDTGVFGDPTSSFVVAEVVWYANVPGSGVNGTMPQSTPGSAPVQIIVANAVAAVPTLTDRVPGSTAARTLSPSLSRGRVDAIHGAQPVDDVELAGLVLPERRDDERRGQDRAHDAAVEQEDLARAEVAEHVAAGGEAAASAAVGDVRRSPRSASRCAGSRRVGSMNAGASHDAGSLPEQMVPSRTRHP